jgi:hypothetical protein
MTGSGGKPTFERQQHHDEAKVDPARHVDPAAGRLCAL